MLIGNGLVASAFGDFAAPTDCTIFAAGVSNSRETAREAFLREAERLRSALRETSGLFVYFGTCSQFDPMQRDAPYVRHKIAMEQMIAESGRPWRVFRLPQVVGRVGGNPDTLVNYFSRRLLEREPFEVWANASRALIAVEHVGLIARRLLALDAPSHATNFWTTTVTPLEIVRELESILGVKGRYTVTTRGVPFAPEAEEFHAACAAAGLVIDGGYTARVLRGAYGR